MDRERWQVSDVHAGDVYHVNGRNMTMTGNYRKNKWDYLSVEWETESGRGSPYYDASTKSIYTLIRKGSRTPKFKQMDYVWNKTYGKGLIVSPAMVYHDKTINLDFLYSVQFNPERGIADDKAIMYESGLEPYVEWVKVEGEYRYNADIDSFEKKVR